MSPTVTLVLGMGAVFGAFLGLALLVWRQQDRDVAARDGGYRAYCASRGYQYTPSRPGAEKAYVQMLGFFNQGANRSWGYEIAGTLNGRPFTAFEYTMDLGGRYSKLYPYALIRWHRDGAGMPAFLIVPGDLDSLRKEPSGRVEFPEDDLFTFGFAVIASDAAPVQAFLTQERRNVLRPHLVADPEQYVSGAGDTLFWYRTTSLPPPEDLDRFIAAGDAVGAALLYA